MPAPLNDELALRIGLAAKALDGVDTKELIGLLIQIMGEPITLAKIGRLRAKKIREAGEQLFSHVSSDSFEIAFALLKGRGVRQYLHPRPMYRQGTYCEISGSLRVACTSDSGENIDGAFSRCVRFLIYQVSPDYIRLIDIREPKVSGDKDQRNQARANLISDCSVVYTTDVGAQAAAKVVKVGLHPIKLTSASDAHQALQKLQQVISRPNPPPWLAKAMGKQNRGLRLYGENVL